MYCADGRSQWDNRQRARAELTARLRQRAEQADAAATNAARQPQVNPERSGKMFTWNTQRGTVVDHSTGQTWRLNDFRRGRLKG